ncbi:hypothetical protein AgCh_022251 [Apium graveolens]
MNRTKLPIRKRLENVMQSSESVDAAVAEVGATNRLGALWCRSLDLDLLLLGDRSARGDRRSYDRPSEGVPPPSTEYATQSQEDMACIPSRRLLFILITMTLMRSSVQMDLEAFVVHDDSSDGRSNMLRGFTNGKIAERIVGVDKGRVWWLTSYR